MVNHASKNEMYKITIIPYLDGTFNHATMDKTVKINNFIFIWHMDTMNNNTQGMQLDVWHLHPVSCFEHMQTTAEK